MADQTNAEVSDDRLREIEPCPFCGKELEFSENLSIHGGGWMHHGDEAERDKPCFLIGKIVYNTPGDLERWNRRSVTSQASEGAEYWAVWSRTGALIGTWDSEEIARAVHLGQYPDGIVLHLYASPSKRVERLEALVEELKREIGSWEMQGADEQPTIVADFIDKFLGGRS